jgi:hypothetical protein
VIFILGFFLDFIEIAVVVVPIVAPILLADPSANITAVWLGVMIGLNIQTSFLTPPFGFALFYLRGVAPAIVKTVQIYKGVVPFICLQLLALVIVGAVPSFVNYLPSRMSLTSSTAPPPANPRLQYCMEKYVFAEYGARGEEIREAIARARRLDIGYLPKKLRSATGESFDKAQATFDLLDEISRAEAAVSARHGDYSPLHRQVRSIQRRIAKIDVETTDLDSRIGLMDRNGGGAEGDREALTARIADLRAERADLEAAIPADWETEHKKFVVLLDADKKARRLYRQNADGAYEPIIELLGIVAATDRLAGLESRIKQLESAIVGGDPKDAVARIAEVAKLVGKVDGAGAIRSQLSKARRALKSKKPDPEKALASFNKALQAYDEDLSWRRRASKELLPGLRDYEATIRDTIGLRQQPRIPEKQALEIAGCNSAHRDISLNF